MKYQSKFEQLYKKIIIENVTNISEEQIIIDLIQDEILENGDELKENWKMHVSPIVTYVNEHLTEDSSILSIDYLDLVNLVIQALSEFDLYATEAE